MNKIQKLSRFFKNVFTVIFWGWPIVLILIWFQDQHNFFAQLGFNILNSLPKGIAEHLLRPLSLSEKFSGFLVSCIPATISMTIAFLLKQLFNGFQRSEIFTLQNIQSIRRIGVTMFIWAAVNPFYQALMSFVMTHNNPHGERLIVISLGTDYFRNLITAGLIFLIAYIMQEGLKLREEQALTV